MNELYFFEKTLNKNDSFIHLNVDESNHITNVLRLKKGATIYVINGHGLIAKAYISDLSKKNTLLDIFEINEVRPQSPQIHLAVSMIKQRDRLEWLIEKATELGISKISFLQTQRSERKGVNIPRLQKLMVSALKQSKNLFLPELYEPLNFSKFLSECAHQKAVKLIAYCGSIPESYFAELINKKVDSIIMIGPEGDFTEKEIDEAIGKSFAPVSLGNMRLKTETAAIFAISVIKSFYES